jgi:hypothetical protein
MFVREYKARARQIFGGCERGDLNPHALRHRILRLMLWLTPCYDGLCPVGNTGLFCVRHYSG